MALTKQNVYDYLGIDFEDEATERTIELLMDAANYHMAASLGQGYPRDDSRVKTMMLMIIADLYDNRELSDKTAGAVRRLMQDFSLQVRLEMRADP